MKRVSVIDSHTGGEPTRVVVAGGPELGGGSVADRLEIFREQHDKFRSAVVNEPRGSDVVVGALLIEPADKACAAGVIFFNNVGCLAMCGHGTIGLVATLAHLGKIQPGDHKIETPVGIVTATLHANGDVSVANVPSFRKAKSLAIEVPQFGTIPGDVAWGGNWFFLVGEHGRELSLANVEAHTDFTWRFRQAVNAQGFPQVDHIELFGPPQLAKLDSGVTIDVAGAVYFSKDAHFSPDRYLNALQSQAEKLGAHFEWNAEVKNLVVRENRIAPVKTSRGEFSADEIVLCGGSWSPLLARELNLKIPIQAGKGYSLTLPRPRELPRLCSIFNEARMAITPMGTSLRFGGTMEIAGLNEDINPVRMQGIIKAVPNYFPKFTPEDFAGISRGTDCGPARRTDCRISGARRNFPTSSLPLATR